MTSTETRVAPNTFDLGKEVDASTAALGMLNLQDDPIRGHITDDFEDLMKIGIDGAPFIQFSSRVVTLARLIKVSDRGNYADGKKYLKTYVSDLVWGSGSGSIAEDPGAFDTHQAPHARLALFNPDSSTKQLVRYPGLLLGDRYDESDRKNQYKSFLIDKKAFEANNPGLDMRVMTTHDVVILALAHRLKNELMPLMGVDLIDMSQPCVDLEEVDKTGPFYRSVRSTIDGSGLRLDGLHGEMYTNRGIGVTIGKRAITYLK